MRVMVNLARREISLLETFFSSYHVMYSLIDKLNVIHEKLDASYRGGSYSDKTTKKDVQSALQSIIQSAPHTSVIAPDIKTLVDFFHEFDESLFAAVRTDFSNFSLLDYYLLAVKNTSARCDFDLLKKLVQYTPEDEVRQIKDTIVQKGFNPAIIDALDRPSKDEQIRKLEEQLAALRGK